jgi:hypothetical protein
MASRAQVSIELLMSLVIILLILIVITLYSIEKSQESRDLRTFIDARRICNSVAENLDAIQQQGRGYYKYFTVPDRIEGNYDYSISINKSTVEVIWGERAWAVTTTASNVTVYCLDYGENQTNRIRNEGNYLSITCYRPNIRPLGNSVRHWNLGGNVTVSVTVENDGHANSPAFNVSIDGGVIPVGALDAYQRTEVNRTIAGFPTGGYAVTIQADYGDKVDESIESDNTINHTITI